MDQTGYSIGLLLQQFLSLPRPQGCQLHQEQGQGLQRLNNYYKLLEQVIQETSIGSRALHRLKNLPLTDSN